MRKLDREKVSGNFKVLAHTSRSEGARMVLSPGESTGGRTTGTPAPISGSSSCPAGVWPSSTGGSSSLQPATCC